MIWTLQRLKAGRRVTAPLVAREFGCGVRTAYRDFDFLRDAWRTPMEFDRAFGSFRLTEPTAPLPPIELSQASWWRSISRKRCCSSTAGGVD